MAEDLPYRVEYAKSGRASCKVCKTPISKDALRIATVVQSPFHDGKMEKWHHVSCFFQKQRPKAIGDIAHFDNIRYEDQEFIKKKLDECAGKGPAAATPKGSRKRTKVNSDFSVEYAKSNRSKCRGCEETIIKEEVRISKKDYESEEARKFGGLDRWYHIECFAKLRAELEFYDQGDALPGAKVLSKEDKAKLKSALPKIKSEDLPPPVKKPKEEPVDDKEEKELKSQSKKLFSIRDHLKALTKNQMVEMLESNKQFIPTGNSEILDLLADVMIFGALEPCKKCKTGNFNYVSGTGYKCTGDISEWAHCDNVTQDPKRQKFKVPSDLQEKYPFLAAYKSKVKKRVIRITAPSTSLKVKKEDTTEGPKVQGRPRPLKHLEFVIIGKLNKSKDDISKEILLLGGNLKSKITKDTAAVISTPAEVEKMSKKMQEAQEFDICVISEDFLEEAKEFTEAPVVLLKKKTISTWGGDPSSRISKSIAEKSTASKSKSKYEKSGSGIVKLRVKGGGAVDPDSGLEDEAHVYQIGSEKYTVTLGNTDIQTGKNSYYKLQILKHDNREKYWLFRSWGRIGTTIGGNKLENLALEECIDQFEKLYHEKSGNEWRLRRNFQKKPHCMYPIDVVDQDDEVDSNVLTSDIDSKLKKPVQDLMRLIFDINSMKKVMLEYEIDLEKMPLGKLSRKQIQTAYSILSELLKLVKSNTAQQTDLISKTNQFYTLIPHSFGVAGPNIIDNEEEIKLKSEMLESLLEMEIAYSLLHSETDENKNPLDAHYEQLKTDIDTLDKESEEFKLIKKYVKNTHAETHRQYELEVEDVFIIKKSGESSRYKKYQKLQNKKLLWHGSRVTNYAGILSKGLRIAPPEAPVTGYMFGKGIYFADMVSKSANYCCTNRDNPTGLLLLCEVALGEMYERFNADYIENLPSGKHSTYGRGKTMPDPEKSVVKNGVEVPCGPAIPVELPTKKSSLLYNEFIVYDVSQVQMKYLVKTNFKYKY